MASSLTAEAAAAPTVCGTVALWHILTETNTSDLQNAIAHDTATPPPAVLLVHCALVRPPLDELVLLQPDPRTLVRLRDVALLVGLQSKRGNSMTRGYTKCRAVHA
jgi:hypothetical protein